MLHIMPNSVVCTESKIRISEKIGQAAKNIDLMSSFVLNWVIIVSVNQNKTIEPIVPHTKDPIIAMKAIFLALIS